MTQPHRARHPNEPKWARQKFVNSSESFFLRFSGLDLHARMLTHLEDEVEIGNIWSNEYEDYTMGELKSVLPAKSLQCLRNILIL